MQYLHTVTYTKWSPGLGRHVENQCQIVRRRPLTLRGAERILRAQAERTESLPHVVRVEALRLT